MPFAMKITFDTDAATLTIDQSPPQPVPPDILAQLQKLLHPLLAGSQEPAAGVADDQDDGDGPDAESPQEDASDIPTHAQMWQDESAARMKRRVAVRDMS
jgi:hypothetical protein